MLDVVKNSLAQRFPSLLTDKLVEYFEGVLRNHSVKKYELAELNGGKFCEVVFRMLESEMTQGTYTPLGNSVRDLGGALLRVASDIRWTNVTFQNQLEDSSFRIHIPHICLAVYGLRNKRGVGHASAIIDPNYGDSSFVLTSCKWIIAELYSIANNYDPRAFDIVDRIISRNIDIVQDINGRKKMLNPKIKGIDQVLVILYSYSSNAVSLSLLRVDCDVKNITLFKKLLKRNSDSGFIDYRDENIAITHKGIQRAEECILKYANVV